MRKLPLFHLQHHGIHASEESNVNTAHDKTLLKSSLHGKTKQTMLIQRPSNQVRGAIGNVSQYLIIEHSVELHGSRNIYDTSMCERSQDRPQAFLLIHRHHHPIADTI